MSTDSICIVVLYIWIIAIIVSGASFSTALYSLLGVTIFGSFFKNADFRSSNHDRSRSAIFDDV